jgi:hypothetical protein
MFEEVPPEKENDKPNRKNQRNRRWHDVHAEERKGAFGFDSSI